MTGLPDLSGLFTRKDRTGAGQAAPEWLCGDCARTYMHEIDKCWDCGGKEIIRYGIEVRSNGTEGGRISIER